MGRSRYKITEPGKLHFVTCAVLEWLPVFTRPETVDILIEAPAFKQQQAGLRVYACWKTTAIWCCKRQT